MRFEWDANKAIANKTKHEVTFEEAETVFADPLAALFPDLLHSNDEERSLIVGHSAQGRLLFVSYVEREEDIRLISARVATRREREKHEQETS